MTLRLRFPPCFYLFIHLVFSITSGTVLGSCMWRHFRLTFCPERILWWTLRVQWGDYVYLVSWVANCWLWIQDYNHHCGLMFVTIDASKSWTLKWRGVVCKPNVINLVVSGAGFWVFDHRWPIYLDCAHWETHLLTHHWETHSLTPSSFSGKIISTAISYQ